MNLDPVLRSRIDSLLQQNRIELFMKGTRGTPRCGFSAGTVGILNGLLDDYLTVDVLADAEIREGIKAYGNWPTIPQLYVDGELIGGADIVAGMANSGELHELLGLPKPDRTPPTITITDSAAEAMRAGLAGSEGAALHLSIAARFQAQFYLREAEGHEIRASANGIDSQDRHREGDDRESSRWQRPRGHATCSVHTIVRSPSTSSVEADRKRNAKQEQHGKPGHER